MIAQQIKIACLPIGQEWPAFAHGKLTAVLAGLPRRITVQQFDPALDEGSILRRVEEVRRANPEMVLLAAQHGASARAITLAAVKCRVPVGIWCHDERHSLASSALASEALRQIGHPHVLIYGDAAAQDLIAAAGASAATRCLASARIGQLGPLHPNLVSAAVNPLVLLARFGAWVVPLFLSALRSKMRSMNTERIAREMGALRSRCRVQVADASMEKAMALRLAIQELVEEQQLDVVAVDCWNEIMPEWGVSPCLAMAYEDYRVACEGDLALAVSLLAGEAMTAMPGYVGDLYAFDETTGEAVLMHCGGCAGLHAGCEPMEIAEQSPPGTVGGQGRVVTGKPNLPSGPGTCVMLHGERLDSLHLRRCEILRTDCGQQMQLVVRIEGDIAAFRSDVAGNHYVVFPGDAAHAWRLWAEWNEVRVH